MSIIPTIEDNDEEALELLRQIAENTGGIEELAKDDQPRTRRRSLGRNYAVVETADLDPDNWSINSDGTITIQPGEEKPIVNYSVSGGNPTCLAIGANDVKDLKYKLVRDNTFVVGNETESPLGTVGSPFSFVQELDAGVPANSRLTYYGVLPSSAGSSVDVAGRMHVEVL
jgi:hypothetical protein